MQLMKNIRESIKEDRFPQFVQDFMARMFPDFSYPVWVVNALQDVNIHLRNDYSTQEQCCTKEKNNAKP